LRLSGAPCSHKTSVLTVSSLSRTLVVMILTAKTINGPHTHMARARISARACLQRCRSVIHPASCRLCARSIAIVLLLLCFLRLLSAVRSIGAGGMRPQAVDPLLPLDEVERRAHGSHSINNLPKGFRGVPLCRQPPPLHLYPHGTRRPLDPQDGLNIDKQSIQIWIDVGY